jgi:hypothetical protein
MEAVIGNAKLYLVDSLPYLKDKAENCNQNIFKHRDMEKMRFSNPSLWR